MEHSKTVGEWLTKPYQTVEKTWQTSLILKKPELTPQVASSSYKVVLIKKKACSKPARNVQHS